MLDKKSCELCGGIPAGTGFNRVGGFDVCDGCLYGDMKTRLRHLGITVEGKVTEVHRRAGAGYHSTEVQLCYAIEIAGSCGATTAGIALALSRETFGAKLQKLFTKEIQVGDPLFDDYVFIRCGGDEQAARAFLAHEGVQTTIMELIGAEGQVTVEGGDIGVHTVHEEFSAFERCQLAAACLLVHLTRLT